ncbi:lipopolysaccharide assembly protein LapB [Alkalilimnicola sp. S0819]|uniref:lipopolysaccharide assembly protein LapB n=1 Tax=Alkalilimnicola sp. S0819 TaxID=2613922 RepID=UPI001261D71E|nr:lipopolysaccharide assembly protein LapB [Alkalilimnicola sp. S0819]KAB7623655.1 lipopolysaccharide assembly protein LapB [Alkalilimnicola sp. S0819]MPQ16779.1 lipopolysaccharide assembly protein LapB [Alkalilimnicola sp. S0819]
MWELLWLLLPVAAASGWYAGRRSLRREAEGGGVSNAYFQGLNFLLNEEPDRAIEVFIRLAEVDSDTVETHLALGNLFRRRGEVDRAIRIHQNLIARPTLSPRQRAYALLELGEDYMRAGLLDRAETLFAEVEKQGEHRQAAQRSLLQIYQQMKEWERAVNTALRLESSSGEGMRPVIAQFYCEQAEQAIARGEVSAARTALKRALAHDPGCVRASILQGDMARTQGHPKAALKAYQQAAKQDPEYLPELLEPMRSCYQALGQPRAMAEFLEPVLGEGDSVSAVLCMTDLIREHKGERAALSFLAEQLRRRPSVRGLNRLIELNIHQGDQERRQDLLVLRELFHELLSKRPRYECRNCGFTSKSLYWHCPSCKSWSTVKPIRGAEGE